LFLAGIGTVAGAKFTSTLASGGLSIILVGGALTLLSATLILTIGYKVLGIPYSLLMGIVSGAQTQPAVLAFAAEQTADETPNAGYTIVFPLAMVTKIILAQILLAVLS
jgi:putative transport protein